MDKVQSSVDHEPKLTTSRLINLAKRGWTLDLSQTDCESKSQVQARNPYKGSQAWQKPKHTKSSQDDWDKLSNTAPFDPRQMNAWVTLARQAG